MSHEPLTLKISDHIATVTLNRPVVYNAVDLHLARELLDALTRVDKDEAVRCVVLTGAGKAFCAGGDVKEFQSQLSDISTHLNRLTHSLHSAISHIARMPKPVIAAVNGIVAGGGIRLMLACDLSYAVETATLTMAYTGIGANPDASATFWLPRLVGARRALELTYLNRTLTADEAYRWGLLNGVISPDRFPDAVHDVARKLADGPTLAYSRSKRLCYISANETLETQMENEAREIVDSGRTHDFREGVDAFIKKRPPSFQGR